MCIWTLFYIITISFQAIILIIYITRYPNDLHVLPISLSSERPAWRAYSACLSSSLTAYLISGQEFSPIPASFCSSLPLSV